MVDFSGFVCRCCLAAICASCDDCFEVVLSVRRAEPRQARTGALICPGSARTTVPTVAMPSSVGSDAMTPGRNRSCENKKYNGSESVKWQMVHVKDL